MLIFVFLFSSASFNYYLVNFYLKYIPGNIFVNTIVSSIAETLSAYFAGFVILKLGAPNSLTTMFTVGGISGIFLWLATSKDWLSMIPFIVLTAKLGVASAFGMLYMSTL